MLATKVKTLTKRELVDHLSRKSIVSKKDIERFLNLFTGIIMASLKNGDLVQLIPFGTFGTRVRKQRQGRNPKTGKPLIIQSIRIAFFRPGRWLRNGMK